MKKAICWILALCLALVFTGCGGGETSSGPDSAQESHGAESAAPTASPAASKPTESAPPESAPGSDAPAAGEAEAGPAPAESGGGKILVAYFSCTGTTKAAAETVREVLGEADLFEIVPREAYTAEDLDYNSDCRANREQNDDSARPAVAERVERMEDYEVVCLGFPIWWGKCPRIIQTFLESYDFSGKTIVPFCTSGSSPFNAAGLGEAAPGTVIAEGKRLNRASAEEVSEWLNGLNLFSEEEPVVEKLRIEANGNTFTAVFADNSSAEAFRDVLRNGPVTVAAHDYGDFEKVGPLGFDLPTNDEQITTEPGDVILYLGSNITVYYDVNSWSFTRLAKIENVPADLKEKLGSGDVDLVFSLAE